MNNGSARVKVGQRTKSMTLNFQGDVERRSNGMRQPTQLSVKLSCRCRVIIGPSRSCCILDGKGLSNLTSALPDRVCRQLTQMDKSNFQSEYRSQLSFLVEAIDDAIEYGSDGAPPNGLPISCAAPKIGNGFGLLLTFTKAPILGTRSGVNCIPPSRRA